MKWEKLGEKKKLKEIQIMWKRKDSEKKALAGYELTLGDTSDPFSSLQCAYQLPSLENVVQISKII